MTRQKAWKKIEKLKKILRFFSLLWKFETQKNTKNSSLSDTRLEVDINVNVNISENVLVFAKTKRKLTRKINCKWAGFSFHPQKLEKRLKKKIFHSFRRFLLELHSQPSSLLKYWKLIVWRKNLLANLLFHKKIVIVFIFPFSTMKCWNSNSFSLFPIHWRD